ncbi:MAG: SGNH/GDSL hydrolase family protein [Cyanobacteriota bacterium]|nr:SGNH/GDSL hydrolase family protein [Cyanobacteriota bacterium]
MSLSWPAMLKSLKQVKLSKINRFLLLTFCWLILPLLLLEILVTVLEPYLFKGLYQYDPDLGFKVRPYANGNNQFGFNDRDYPLLKEPGKYRALIVSDSFNWAGGQNGNYTALLEQKFESYYGQHRVDIINAGYPGTHTVEQLAMLKKYGLQYNPDLVVLGFFAGNDFRDADPHRKRIIVNDLYVDIDRRKELIIFGYPIIGQSRLLLFVEQKYKVWQELRRAKKEAKKPQVSLLVADAGGGAIAQNNEPEKSPGILSQDAFLQVEKSRLKFCKKEDLQRGKRDKNINYILNGISEMKALLDSKEIEFMVAIYPDEYQVSDRLFQEIMQRFGLDPADYIVNCQQQILIRYLEANGIPYIDMLGNFRKEQNNRPLYLLREPHWNSAGNQLAAEILFDYLIKKSDRLDSIK